MIQAQCRKAHTQANLAPDLEALVEAATVQARADIRRAAWSIQEFASTHGLRAALCANIAAKDPMRDADGRILAYDVFGWRVPHERWWEQPNFALTAPFPRACRYESEPFWCNAKGSFRIAPNPYLDDINFAQWFDAQEGCKAAIVVPVHLAFSQVSANCFVPIDGATEDLSDDFAALAPVLAAITRRFIASYVAVSRTKRCIPSNHILSRREVECLHWAAVGKTDHEIASIIALSHATVRYYLHCAGAKLNAVSRAQSVFKAGQLGYLGFNA
jgi:DNA-binding CsgD family transcriptional regulator